VTTIAQARTSSRRRNVYDLTVRIDGTSVNWRQTVQPSHTAAVEVAWEFARIVSATTPARESVAIEVSWLRRVGR
jgi:hypothetical protein